MILLLKIAFRTEIATSGSFFISRGFLRFLSWIRDDLRFAESIIDFFFIVDVL